MHHILILIFITISAEAQVERVTSILEEPFLMLKQDHYQLNGNDKYVGFAKDLTDLLATRLNFTYALSLVVDNKYGKLTKGSWNGIMGELLSDDDGADISIAPMTITRERTLAVDFSTPFIEFQLAILLRKPGFNPDGGLPTNPQTSGNQTSNEISPLVLRPISLLLWIASIVTISLLMLLSFLIECFIRRKRGEASVKVSYSGRALQFIFWAFVTLLFIVYMGYFTTERLLGQFGSQRSNTLDIKSIRDLANQDNIRYGVMRAGSTFEYFRISQDRVLRRMYSLMTSDTLNTLPRTVDEGVGRVRYGIQPYAYILEGPYAHYQATLQPCDVIIAPKYFGPKRGYGVATRPNHTLKSRINLAVLGMKENGEIEELENKWFRNKDNCENEETKNFQIEPLELQLGFGQLTGLFIVSTIPVVLTIAIATCELCFRKKRKSSKSNSASGFELERWK